MLPKFVSLAKKVFIASENCPENWMFCLFQTQTQADTQISFMDSFPATFKPWPHVLAFHKNKAD